MTTKLYLPVNTNSLKELISLVKLYPQSKIEAQVIDCFDLKSSSDDKKMIMIVVDDVITQIVSGPGKL